MEVVVEVDVVDVVVGVFVVSISVVVVVVEVVVVIVVVEVDVVVGIIIALIQYKKKQRGKISKSMAWLANSCS